MQSMGGTNLATNRLDDLNAGDIERVEVIKGAAAATLYGTEASSGVIQIFTKRGQVGEPIYSYEITQQALKMPDRISPVFAYSPANRQIATSSPGDDFIRTGHHQNYNMSVRGGSEGVQYYVSGRFMHETGTLPTNQVGNRSGRMALDFQHSERLSSKLDVGIIRNVAEAPQPFWGLVGEFVLANPWNVSELRPYGELFNTIRGAIAFSNVQTTDNNTLSGTVNYQWIDGLTSRVTIGYNQVNQSVVQFIPVGAGLRDSDGVRDLTDRNSTAFTVDVATNYVRNVTESITSTTTVGGQSFWETLMSKRTGVRGFPSASLNTLRGGSTVFAVDEFQEEVINAGVFAQQQFGFNNRLFLTVGLRMDGNSAFGENFGLETYPKVGASWVVSDHNFWSFESMGWDLLRLRGAFGTSGLQPGAFDAQRTWRPTALVSNDPAVMPENLGNPDLKPERSTEMEVAAEMGFFDGRLGVEAVYWSQETSDALLPVQSAPSLGFLNRQLQNIGRTTSSGIEISTILALLQRPNFRWDLNAAYTNTSQEVVDMGGVAGFRLAGARRLNRIQEGYAPGAILAPIADPRNPYTVSGGIENLTGVNQISPNLLKNAAGADSLVYIGDALPNWTVTLGTTMSLGSNWSLRTMFSGEGGFVMSNETELIRTAIGLTERAANIHMELADPSTSTDRRRQIAEEWGTKHPNVISAWMEDGTYLRWAELTLTYKVPQELSQRIGFGNTTVSLGGRNLALFTGYSGIADPGSSSAATSDTENIRDFVSNIDYFGAPVARRLVFSLRTTR
jgi:TonB-dependent SusC/RagA subfamily outer membrane receptor